MKRCIVAATSSSEQIDLPFSRKQFLITFIIFLAFPVPRDPLNRQPFAYFLTEKYVILKIFNEPQLQRTVQHKTQWPLGGGAFPEPTAQEEGTHPT